MSTTSSYNSRRGRVFLNNRYHDPVLGMFISVDPLVTTTGEPYIYASGNPTTLSDPTGLCSTNSEEGAACYAKQYADGQQGHNRFIGRLWSIWYSKHVGATHYVDSFRDQPDTHGYAAFYVVTSGRPDRAANDLADRAFIDEVTRSIAGMADTGNGWLLLPEEEQPGQEEEQPGQEGDFRGPFRDGDRRTHMGAVGWRADLADDDSPEGHVAGYLAFGYIYGENMSRAGLNFAEWNAGELSDSQQDFDLGLIGIGLGQRLVSGDYSGNDLIRDLAAATAGSWSGSGDPPRIPPSGIGPTTMRGNALCYAVGFAC